MKLDIDSLEKSAGDFSVKDEETGQMTLSQAVMCRILHELCTLG